MTYQNPKGDWKMEMQMEKGIFFLSYSSTCIPTKVRRDEPELVALPFFSVVFCYWLIDWTYYAIEYDE